MARISASIADRMSIIVFMSCHEKCCARSVMARQRVRSMADVVMLRRRLLRFIVGLGDVDEGANGLDCFSSSLL